MGRLIVLLLALLGWPVEPLAGRAIGVSAAPDQVAVTLYRDPERRADGRLNLDWLNGFALVSETRTIRIPAGEVELRFEGVAANILPQSAIVSGLPDGLIERNYDAALLSPATLIERSLGRRVHLRRTSLATGASREEEAFVRSGAEGALVLQTAEGFEALRCTGLAETVLHEGIPPGLSARPTLSIRTRSRAETVATLTLSYLAAGFDWQADYVATLDEAGEHVDLFAWLTLANGDETSFRDARTQAVAGQVNHQPIAGRGRPEGAIHLRCWPQGRTSDIPLDRFEAKAEEIIVTGSRMAGPPPPPPPAPAMAPEAAMEAAQEELGDLKLYRIPEPVTLAARSQKQVAFLRRERVPVALLHRLSIRPGTSGWVPAQRLLVTRNRTAERLGIPLPAGRLVLFAEGRERPILLGEGSLGDKAVGETVEIELGAAPGVRVQTVQQAGDPDEPRFTVTATNDQARPVTLEAILPHRRVRSSSRLARRNGWPVWRVTVPANGRVELTYSPRSEG